MPLEDAIRSILREELRAAVREEFRAILEQVQGPSVAGSTKEFLSVREAALVAGVSRGTIRTWLQRGQLRRYGEGRVVRVRRPELMEFMAAAGEQMSEPGVPLATQATAILGRHRPR